MSNRLAILRVYFRSNEQVRGRPAHTVLLHALHTRRLYQVSVYQSRWAIRFNAHAEGESASSGDSGYVLELVAPESELYTFVNEESVILRNLAGPIVLLAGETLITGGRWHSGRCTASLAVYDQPDPRRMSMAAGRISGKSKR